MAMTHDVAVIGGGVVGLGMAGQMAGHGKDVVVLERGDVGREASYASGGMLSPFMELDSHEPELLAFGQTSLKRYESFIDELEQETGEDVGLRTGGTLYVGRHEDQRKQIERLYDYQDRHGVPVDMLEREALRRRESLLDPGIKNGLFSPMEMRVNNRRLSLALMLRCRYRGVEIRSHEPVLELNYGPGQRIQSCRTSRGTVSADQYLIAAGAWSSDLTGLRADDRVPVRPVKGQAVAVQLTDDFLPQHTIRSPEVYCVPHPPERLTIGATSEERGFDDQVTAGGILDLLMDASDLLPGIVDQPVLETWAGFRPGSRDNLPILGPAPGAENLWYATGHYRSGILLLPATVQYLSQYMDTGTCPPELEMFSPERFRHNDNDLKRSVTHAQSKEPKSC